MTTDADSLILSVVDDIRSVEPEAWDRLASRAGVSPFLEHGFLSSLEASAAVSPDAGWYPRHFLLKQGDELIAAAPAYAKTHSMGEFVFDQGLAQAAMDMGADYYPKLVATLPLTPVPGYRFLIDSRFDEASISSLLLQGMKSFAAGMELHSVSVLFADPRWDFPVADADETSFLPWRQWVHQYFVWENRDYGDFNDYLAEFDKNQRRNIRRERASIKDAGIIIEVLDGTQTDEALLDRMFEFYLHTNEQFGPWAALFLNREWFSEAASHWGQRLLFFIAAAPGENDPVAMSLLVRKDDGLWGRYWGTAGFVRNLHFELCYYAPIEYAIQHELKSFDPGMGSSHKVRRGFLSREFSSFHSFTNERTDTLAASVFPQANAAERQSISDLNDSIPWKGSHPAGD